MGFLYPIQNGLQISFQRIEQILKHITKVLGNIENRWNLEVNILLLVFWEGKQKQSAILQLFNTFYRMFLLFLDIDILNFKKTELVGTYFAFSCFE